MQTTHILDLSCPGECGQTYAYHVTAHGGRRVEQVDEDGYFDDMKGRIAAPPRQCRNPKCGKSFKPHFDHVFADALEAAIDRMIDDGEWD